MNNIKPAQKHPAILCRSYILIAKADPLPLYLLFLDIFLDIH